MFWIGKTKNIPARMKEKDIYINLSPVEILLLIQLRVRQIRISREENLKNNEIGLYGYELIKKLNNLFAGAWVAQSGTIYPILTRLESEKGLIRGVRKKSPLGPVKKVYYLTESGKNVIDNLMLETIEDNIDFIINYIDLLSPYIEFIADSDEEFSEKLYQKMMGIPEKILNDALENSITKLDMDMKNKKLWRLRKILENIIAKIDDELSS